MIYVVHVQWHWILEISGSNAKYNQMLKERMDEEDKLHDEVERLKKELAAASSKATILKSYHSTS